MSGEQPQNGNHRTATEQEPRGMAMLLAVTTHSYLTDGNADSWHQLDLCPQWRENPSPQMHTLQAVAGEGIDSPFQ